MIPSKKLSSATRHDLRSQASVAGVSIMQITDTLSHGGLERVAVNLANALALGGYRSHLCTTRRDGPLAGLVTPTVGRLRLQRRTRLDLKAVPRLVSYIRKHRVQVLQAHGSALLLASAVSLIPPHPLVLWHNHGGWLAGLKRSPWWLKALSRRINGIVAVSRPLRDWCIRVLGMPEGRVWYIPNFAHVPRNVEGAKALPGKPGFRIASVANLLPPKDPVNLLHAMKIVVREEPEAHLLMLGRSGPNGYMKLLQDEANDPALRGHVSLFGERNDVPAVLKGCDVGVLSSASEGFPLALVEYGLAGLAVASTQVGECKEILNGGRVGLLVPPAAPEELARAILRLLASPSLRTKLGEEFGAYVRQNYSPEQIMLQLCGVYQCLLEKSLRA